MKIYYQKDLKKAIFDQLQKSNYIYIYGKSGIGKSHIIKNQLKSNFYYEPTDYTRNSSLDYMLAKMGQFKSKYKYKNHDIEEMNDLISDATETKIGKVFSLFSSIYRLICNSNYRKIKLEFSNAHFSTEEISTLLFFEEKSKNGNIYLCFDNTELYTDKINQFLLKIVSLDLAKLFFKNKVKFIFIENTNEQPISPLKDFVDNFIEFIYIDESFLFDLKSILCDENDDKIHNIASISQNSMENAIFLNNHYDELNSDNIDEKTLSNFCNKILSDVLGKGTLEIASVIDDFFDANIISNISQKNADDISIDLKKSEEKGIIKEIDTNYDFVFKYIKNKIYNSAINQNELHRLYAKYLIKTSPDDYENILYHILKSNQSNLFNQKYISAKIMHFLLRVHENNNFIINPSITRLFTINCNLDVNLKFVNDLIDSQDKIDENLEICINQIPNTFVKNYSMIILSLKKLLKRDYINLNHTSQVLVEKSKYLLELQEYDLYLELMLRLITIYDYRLSDRSTALKIRNEIYSFLETNESIFSKQYYQKIFCKYFRHNNTLLNNTSAYNNSKRFINFFINNLKLDFFERYAVLNNHIGFAITCGDFSIIKNNDFLKLKEIIDKGKTFYFDKQFKLTTNYIICKIFNSMNKLSKKQIQGYIRELQKFLNNEYVSKMFLFNIASLYMMNDDLLKSEKILNILANKQEYMVSDYCYLYTISNLISLQLLKSDFNSAINYIKLIDEKLITLRDNYELKSIFIIRSSIFKNLIEQKIIFHSGIDLFNYFYKVSNCKKEDRFYMSGVLFTELTVYNE